MERVRVMVSRAILFMCFTLLLGVMICLGYMYYQDRYVLLNHNTGVFVLDRNSGMLNFCTPDICRTIQRQHPEKIQFNNFIPVIPDSFFKEMLTRSPKTFENAQIASNLENNPMTINPVQDVAPPQPAQNVTTHQKDNPPLSTAPTISAKSTDANPEEIVQEEIMSTEQTPITEQDEAEQTAETTPNEEFANTEQEETPTSEEDVNQTEQEEVPAQETAEEPAQEEDVAA